MTARQERFRILLVDDDAATLKVSLRRLKRLGYSAETASTGREALQKLDQNAYNLVLMDCQMPEMDGPAATRELRRREGNGRRTPVVALSAESNRQDCLEAGMDDYLSKPVEPEALAALLRRLDAPVDLAALKSLAELDEDPAFLKGLVEQFLGDAAKLVAQMKEAAAAGQGFDRQAHTLRGSSATLGANRLRDLCARAESACREGHRSQAKAWAGEIERELQRLSPALRSAARGH